MGTTPTYHGNEAREVSQSVDTPLLQTFAVQDGLMAAQKVLSHPLNCVWEFIQQLIKKESAGARKGGERKSVVSEIMVAEQHQQRTNSYNRWVSEPASGVSHTRRGVTDCAKIP